MVKKTTTAKKITVTGGKTTKKTVAAKATPKTAKTTKKVAKKTPTKAKKAAQTTKKPATTKKTVAAKKSVAKKPAPSKKAAVSKSAVKKTTSVKSNEKPAPVPSPVRKVEELEASDSQFTGTWIMLIIGVLLFVAGLGLWYARENDTPSVDGGSTEVESTTPNNLQPSVRVIES